MTIDKPASGRPAVRQLSEAQLSQLFDAANGSAASPQLPAIPLRLRPNGEIEADRADGHQPPEADVPPERLGRLSPETFAAGRPSLDEVARAMKQAQSTNREPSVNGRTLHVDPEGNFVLDGDEEGRHVGQLSGEAFAVRTDDATAVDSGTVNATRTTAGSLDGWAWSITTEFGDRFDFFGYWDATQRMFFTLLGSPRLENHAPSAHDMHLYPNGTVCLTPQVGCRNLAHAHARSALWARGASCYLAGLGFIFNPGQ